VRRNCLLPDAIEGQMTEVKGVGRRRTQLLNDLRNRRKYWELKEEAEVKKRWRRQFINRT
jgi:hypothetical protein